MIFLLIVRRPPSSTRTDTPFHYTKLLRSDIEPWIAGGQRVCTRLQPCDQFRRPLHQRGQLRLADQEDDVADAAKYRRQRHDHDDRTDRARDLLDVLISEEHTAELQSLMLISYAVFILNKKKQKL